MRTFGLNDLWFIAAAAQWTIALSLIAFIGGAAVGLLLALARTSDKPLPMAVAGAFIQVFQGTPLLLQLFLIFFGLPVLGLEVSPWVAAGTALVLNTGAFLGEIWRGCIQAVPAASGKRPRRWACTTWPACAAWCCRRPSRSRCRPPWATWCR